jgi:hypothetical protein
VQCGELSTGIENADTHPGRVGDTPVVSRQASNGLLSKAIKESTEAGAVPGFAGGVAVGGDWTAWAMVGVGHD